MGQKARPPREPGVDRLVASLNERYGKKRDIRFDSATEEVLCGMDLEATGNRYVGKSIYISTGPRFEPDPDALPIGAKIAVGSRERFPHCELRCTTKGNWIVVAVYAHDGIRLTRELRCAASERKTYDEGLFAWFGPVEWIGTPWSDMDPSNCQVITVHALRAFATRYEPA
jgi:hypothetical protein